jgi:hypothetical protein
MATFIRHLYRIKPKYYNRFNSGPNSNKPLFIKTGNINDPEIFEDPGGPLAIPENLLRLERYGRVRPPGDNASREAGGWPVAGNNRCISKGISGTGQEFPRASSPGRKAHRPGAHGANPHPIPPSELRSAGVASDRRPTGASS